MKKTNVVLAASLMLGFFAPATFGQSVDFLLVSKQHTYTQTDNTTTADTVNPWRFRASVEGSSDISGITTPTMTIPGGTGSTTMAYNSGDNAWLTEGAYGSQSALNAAYANGAYSLTALGQTVSPITLTGDSYTPAPLATLSGGTISGGVLFWDPSQALTITLNGSGIDHMGVFVSGGLYNQKAENFSVSQVQVTINAFDLVAGQSYLVELNFDDIVGGTAPTAVNGTGGMSATEYAAVYGSQTTFTIQAIPEPATYSAIVGGLALAGVLYRRRRPAV